MGEVGIVAIGGEFFREYAIERGDVLSRICRRLGHRDWRAVYDHPANAAFRTRFPDPDVIDYVRSVNLLVPLGAAASARDFHVARIRRPDGTALASTELVLLGPGLPAGGWTVHTSAAGHVIVPNPAAGTWSLVSPGFSLRPAAATGAVAARPLTGTAPVVADPVPLTRNAVDDLVARPVVCLRCPMCWGGYAVTVQHPAAGADRCPRDGADWAPLVAAAETAPATFRTSPSPPQDPTTTPAGLRCRGVEPQATAYGPADVHWDESRFTDPGGGDYTLWGTTATGAVSVDVVGRATWGAAAPNVGPGREYRFHATALGASAMYTLAIPNNESTPLTGVLNWVTIHHTTDPPLNSPATAIALQKKHFVDIGGTGPGADIGYHFVIDGNGDVYEGRPLGIKGSHAEAFNGGNVGIVLAGNFEYIHDPAFDTVVIAPPPNLPTTAQIHALNTLLDVLSARFGIRSVWSHQDRKTQATGGHTYCPGAALMLYIPGIRAHFPGPPA